jgi:hypothetical protein
MQYVNKDAVSCLYWTFWYHRPSVMVEGLLPDRSYSIVLGSVMLSYVHTLWGQSEWPMVSFQAAEFC